MEWLGMYFSPLESYLKQLASKKKGMKSFHVAFDDGSKG